MSETTIDWEAAAENGFDGLTLEQLRDGCAVFGVAVGSRAGADFIKEKLLAVVGTPAAKAAAEPVPPKERNLNGFDPKPNLTASGRWGGRMHRVLIPNTLAGTGSRQIGVPLSWQDKTLYVFFDRPMDIPEPHFNALKDARGAHIIPQHKVRPDGSVEVTNIERPFQSVPYQDLGITPGTEHLPGSRLEYWRTQAGKSDYFARCKRTVLLSIRSDLIGPAGRATFKDVPDADIRWEILEFLGLEQHMDAEAA